MKDKLDELNVEELDRILEDSKSELRKERFKAITSKVDDPQRISRLKKTVARILTLKNEYRLGIRAK